MRARCSGAPIGTPHAKDWEMQPQHGSSGRPPRLPAQYCSNSLRRDRGGLPPAKQPAERWFMP
eukprot:11052410-Alexandrium_andersonii.AAC.1